MPNSVELRSCRGQITSHHVLDFHLASLGTYLGLSRPSMVLTGQVLLKTDSDKTETRHSRFISPTYLRKQLYLQRQVSHFYFIALKLLCLIIWTHGISHSAWCRDCWQAESSGAERRNFLNTDCQGYTINKTRIGCLSGVLLSLQVRIISAYSKCFVP